MYGADVATVVQELGEEREWVQGWAEAAAWRREASPGRICRKNWRKGFLKRTLSGRISGEVRGGRGKNAKDTC